MEQKLIVIDGPDQGRTFALHDGIVVSIGRGQAADFCTSDPRTSRSHCRIEYRDGNPFLIDAGSKGGTFVGSTKVTEHSLKPGDVFQLGDTKIRYAFESSDNESTFIGKLHDPPPSIAPNLKGLIGQKMADYELTEVIAAGRSGFVFKALDTVKNSPVAIKVLTPDFAREDEQKERFVRAMKTMLPIRHPNIIRLINAGKKGQYCWAAMEFIDGESLSKVIQRIGIQNMLDWREVYRVALHIGRALHEAYEQKIIHRNVAPANILRRSSDKVCLLGDLMLAKGLEGSLANQVTQAGQLLGELPFMSPERTEPVSDPDGRSDLYGLGATLYALLTGRPPAVGNSLPVLIANIRHEKPKSPKTFQLAINDKFADLVMQLIEKRPDDRYQTPAAMLIDLERIGKFNSLPMD